MKKTVLQALKKHVKISESILEIPPEPSMGDVALPCFKLSRQMRKSPQLIAAELKNKVKSPGIERMEVVGGYLNFYLNKERVSEKILRAKPGKTMRGRVMVEYANLNTHKDMHIGHLKNVSMGLALVRILRQAGCTVIPAYYINDYGLHVAKVLWYLKKYKPKPPENNRLEWLGETYAKAHEKTKESVENEKEVRQTLESLERKDPETIRLWKETWQWSIDDLEKIYSELGLEIKVRLYEHQFYDKGRGIAEQLLKKGVAEKSQGSVIVNLKKYGLGTAILIKSDGNTLYVTADLSLSSHKFTKYKLDKSVYVVGSEQKHYFQQLFKIMELLGFKQEMVHVPYGLVRFKTGKMSSRLGNIVKYSELSKRMKERAFKETLKRNPNMSRKKIERISGIIAFGALKYGMLRTDNNKPSIFDWEESLKLEGDTAPYIMYSAVRANKILKKSKKKPGRIIELADEEYELIKKIGEYSGTVNQAAEKYSQNLLANYAYDLAQLFNNFYDKHQVIGHELEAQRLLIVKKFSETMSGTLYLLGIEVPEQM